MKPYLCVCVEDEPRAALVPGDLHLLLEEALLGPRLLADVHVAVPRVRTPRLHVVVQRLVPLPLLIARLPTLPGAEVGAEK